MTEASYFVDIGEVMGIKTDPSGTVSHGREASRIAPATSPKNKMFNQSVGQLMGAVGSGSILITALLYLAGASFSYSRDFWNGIPPIFEMDIYSMVVQGAFISVPLVTLLYICTKPLLWTIRLLDKDKRDTWADKVIDGTYRASEFQGVVHLTGLLIIGLLFIGVGLLSTIFGLIYGVVLGISASHCEMNCREFVSSEKTVAGILVASDRNRMAILTQDLSVTIMKNDDLLEVRPLTVFEKNAGPKASQKRLNETTAASSPRGTKSPSLERRSGDR